MRDGTGIPTETALQIFNVQTIDQVIVTFEAGSLDYGGLTLDQWEEFYPNTPAKGQRI